MNPKSKIQSPKSLVLLGGTFDPPHIGHLLLGECARHQFQAPTVVFVPAGDPYRKRPSGVPSAQFPVPSPAEYRLKMMRLAVADNPAFLVDDREVRRAGPTYTIDTLEELHAEGHTRIILVLGGDAIADMPNWKQPERIRELATIALAPKVPSPESRVSSTGPQSKIQNPKSKIIRMPPLAISSTLIRSRVAAGLPIRYLVPEAVEAYIREHRLYVNAE